MKHVPQYLPFKTTLFSEYDAVASLHNNILILCFISQLDSWAFSSFWFLLSGFWLR